MHARSQFNEGSMYQFLDIYLLYFEHVLILSYHLSAPLDVGSQMLFIVYVDTTALWTGVHSCQPH